MNGVAQATACALMKYSGAMAAQEWVARRAGAWHMSIMLFHRVTDEIPEDGLTVSTRWFARFCELMSRSFHVVPVAEIFRLVDGGLEPPPRTVAITFDDCYRDNLFAARTLAAYRLPACFFITTGVVDTDHVFPWDEHLPRLANLTWPEIEEMAGLGHEIGGHTVTHPDMAKVDEKQFREELARSKEALEKRLGTKVRWFAYPFGGRENFRPERLAWVHESGYEGCVSAHGGFVRPGMRGQILPRDPAPWFRNIRKLELHLAGSFDLWYACKRRLGLMP